MKQNTKGVPKAAFGARFLKAAFGTPFGILRMLRVQNYEGVNERWYNLEIPPIAQLVEQLPFKQTVAGSSPAGRT